MTKEDVKKKPKKLPKEKEGPVVHKNYDCLLIELSQPIGDPNTGTFINKSRRFFTHRKNITYIAEFAKAFGAELQIVKASTPTILPLEDLIKSISDINYNDNSPYETISFPLIKSNVYKKKPSNLNGIQNEIKNYILMGGPVSINGLCKVFKKHKLSESTIRRHFKTVKHALAADGINMSKIGKGIYTTQSVAFN